MKKIFLFLILFFITITFVCCKEEKLTISGTDTVEVGCSILLEHNYNGEEEVKWNSGDTTVATIINGLVIGVSEGETIITLTIGEKKTSKVIIVTPSLIEITIKGNNIVFVGQKVQFAAELSKETEEKVQWKSSDEDIAVVNEDGLVTGLKTGSVIISASLYGKTSEFNVEVQIDNSIKITGNKTVRIDETIELSCNYNCYWKSSNEEIAYVSNKGVVYGYKVGTVTITAIDKDDENNIAEFTINVVEKAPTQLVVSGANKLALDGTLSLVVSALPEGTSNEVYYLSSDTNIASVTEDGVVTGMSVGTVIITVISKENEKVTSEFIIEIVQYAPESIEVSGDSKMEQGKHNILKLNVIGENVTKEVKWTSSDPSIAICYQGVVLALKAGKVIITATSVVDDSISSSIEIEIKKYSSEEYSSEDIQYVNNIINNMTLSQKVGQMFTIGFNGTTADKNLMSAIEECNLGNVIYMGYNVTKPSTLSELSNSIQEKMIEENGIPAFISIDQEGGKVARLVNGGTHFISNMAMGATGNYNNTYLEGLAMGKELRNYGINFDFAPVFDVNNNPNNPIIGVRSYADNPILVSLYGNNMFKGLMESNVMGCTKHFPGHGNTSVDTHYGLPTITSSIDELYQIELAPFISAISNGIDAIMTTHIIFSAIDNEYPATLSSKVLTGLLREEFGYNGLIVTDGMEMGALKNNFGSYEETALLAVKAGVDMLLYTSNTTPRSAHAAICSAVENGEITEERINDSVRRILLKKLKYDILDNYNAKNESINDLLIENEKLNQKFADESLTLVKGDFNGLDKNKSTLLISPESSFNLGEDLLYNSFANYAYNYLTDKGHQNCDYINVDNNVYSDDINYVLEMAEEFDQIVIAMSNVKINNYNRTVDLVNKLTKLEKEVIVIALDSPFDLMSYSDDVENYICIYGYQKATVIALSKYLNGEFKASGLLPVSENNFE